MKKFKNQRTDGYASQFEAGLARQLVAAGMEFGYESLVLGYTIAGNYWPDFQLDNGIIIEAKGWFTAEDKRKLIAVKAAHPDKDIRVVFQSSGRGGANLRWATRNGFPAAVGAIPEEWLR